VAEETSATNENTQLTDQKIQIEETKEEVIQTVNSNPLSLYNSDSNLQQYETL
jgi:hypothetical protein